MKKELTDDLKELVGLCDGGEASIYNIQDVEEVSDFEELSRENEGKGTTITASFKFKGKIYKVSEYMGHEGYEDLFALGDVYISEVQEVEKMMTVLEPIDGEDYEINYEPKW